MDHVHLQSTCLKDEENSFQQLSQNTVPYFTRINKFIDKIACSVLHKHGDQTMEANKCSLTLTQCMLRFLTLEDS
jgi:hypothetical protein